MDTANLREEEKVITFPASKSVVFFLSVARLNFYFSSKKVFTAVGATIQLNSGIYLLPQHRSKLYLLASKSVFFISCKMYFSDIVICISLF